MGPLIVYTKATLHVGLTRLVRTKIYFKCISKFRIWRELLCLLKCEVHSVLVMRKRLWTIMAFGRCGFLDFFFQCVCLLQCESKFWRFSRLVAVFSLLLFLFRFAASTFSRVCICLFISTITILFFNLVLVGRLSELSSQFQVVSRSTGLTAISLPESLPFPGKLCGASRGDAGTQEGKIKKWVYVRIRSTACLGCYPVRMLVTCNRNEKLSVVLGWFC